MLLGNPANRRVHGFQAALAAEGLAPARVVAWASFLRRPDALRDALGGDTVLRIDSPGEDHDVERLLVARGADVPDPDHPRASRIPAADALAAAPDPGRIWCPRQWFLGFRDALDAVREAVADAGAHATSDPDDIVAMFDKRACHARLSAHGVPVAPALPPAGSWGELRAAMDRAGVRRVFVKLLAGSSASGVVALEVRPGGAIARTTAVPGPDGALHNVLRVRTVSGEAAIAPLVDRLLAEGAHVERWLPKAQLGKRALDLRVVAIDGRATHMVVRVADGPLTNLHLGNRRGDLERFFARLGAGHRRRLEETVEAAAAAFPRTRMVGFDVWVAPAALVADSAPELPFAVLEANAFGDLLPGVEADGRDTWRTQVRGLGGGLDANAIVGRGDIVLVTLDTLRYDAAVDALRRGLPNLGPLLGPAGWEERHTPGSFTFSAHAAFFAGFLPTPAAPGRHERLFACAFPGSETSGPRTCVLDAPDLPTGLAARGYHTACIGGTGFFNRLTPLGRVLPDRFAEAHWSPALGVTDPRSTEHQVAVALDVLARTPAARVFLFLNVSAIHQPNRHYLPGATEDSPATQAAALAYVDRALAPLLAALRARGTHLLILTSDHGHAYGDDGWHGHRLGHPVVWTVPYAERLVPGASA